MQGQAGSGKKEQFEIKSEESARLRCWARTVRRTVSFRGENIATPGKGITFHQKQKKGANHGKRDQLKITRKSKVYTSH